jgi:hypothetical protein
MKLVVVTLVVGLASMACTAQVPAHSGNDLVSAIKDLVVADEQDRNGYDRKAFRHWVDADGDGCDTRVQVLIDEAVTTPVRADGCSLSGGVWESYYDSVQVIDASLLDIDHVVPLAEAWDSGAYQWDADRRRSYANDVERPEALVAVTRHTNRSKGDSDPQEWLPPDEAAWCRYVAEWVSIKLANGLSADPGEVAVLETLAADCPTQEVHIRA